MAAETTQYGKRRFNSDSVVFVIESLVGKEAAQVHKDIMELGNFRKFIVDLHHLQGLEIINFTNFVRRMIVGHNEKEFILEFCGPKWTSEPFAKLGREVYHCTSDELSVVLKDIAVPGNL